MMHPQIENEEIIERYVRNQLAEEERKAFEEHYFGCDDCFEKLQVTERFVAGVRDAARHGALAPGAEGGTRVWSWDNWLVPAFGASACAALVLVVLSGWLYFVRIPQANERLNQSAAELRETQAAQAALEQQLERSTQAEVNLPLVILQSTRALQSPPTEAILPAAATHLVLWVDVSPSHYSSYRLELYGAEDKPIETLHHLKRNSYGALAAALPTERLQPGDYRIKLTGEKPLASSPLAEYKLRIRRP
ncbi:MAG: zf-HC2 domain-containing protein [Candidatus Acidiferrum sp.]